MSAVLGKYTQLIKQKNGGYTSKEIEVISSDGNLARTKCGMSIPVLDLFDDEMYAKNDLADHHIDQAQGFIQSTPQPSAPQKSIFDLGGAASQAPSPAPVQTVYAQAPSPAPVIPAKNYSEGQVFVESAITMSKKSGQKKTIMIELPLELDFDVELIKQIAKTMGVSDNDLATVVSDNLNFITKDIMKQVAITALGVDEDALKESEPTPEPEIEETSNIPTILVGGQTFIDDLVLGFAYGDTHVENVGETEGMSLQDMLFDDVLTKQLIIKIADQFGVDPLDIEFMYNVDQLKNLHTPSVERAMDDIRNPDPNESSEPLYEGQEEHEPQEDVTLAEEVESPSEGEPEVLNETLETPKVNLPTFKSSSFKSIWMKSKNK